MHTSSALSMLPLTQYNGTTITSPSKYSSSSISSTMTVRLLDSNINKNDRNSSSGITRRKFIKTAAVIVGIGATGIGYKTAQASLPKNIANVPRVKSTSEENAKFLEAFSEGNVYWGRIVKGWTEDIPHNDRIALGKVMRKIKQKININFQAESLILEKLIKEKIYDEEFDQLEQQLTEAITNIHLGNFVRSCLFLAENNIVDDLTKKIEEGSTVNFELLDNFIKDTANQFTKGKNLEIFIKKYVNKKTDINFTDDELGHYFNALEQLSEYILSKRDTINSLLLELSKQRKEYINTVQAAFAYNMYYYFGAHIDNIIGKKIQNIYIGNETNGDRQIKACRYDWFSKELELNFFGFFLDNFLTNNTSLLHEMTFPQSVDRSLRDKKLFFKLKRA